MSPVHTPSASSARPLRSAFAVALAFAVVVVFLVVIPAGNLLHKVSPTLSPTVDASSTAHARGAELFATHGCAHCHGTDGVNGEIGPDLQQVRNRMTAAQIITQIHDGSKNMPAFADTLSTPQIDDLIAYLRTKRKHIIPPPPPKPTPKPDPDGN
jgi:mono/diheme cytochrome c family protein